MIIFKKLITFFFLLLFLIYSIEKSFEFLTPLDLILHISSLSLLDTSKGQCHEPDKGQRMVYIR